LALAIKFRAVGLLTPNGFQKVQTAAPLVRFWEITPETVKGEIAKLPTQAAA
jgi:hypothetical protein